MGEPDDLLEDEFRPHFEAWKATPSPLTSSNLIKATQPVLDAKSAAANRRRGIRFSKIVNPGALSDQGGAITAGSFNTPGYY
jgi:hypothetical protein